MFIEEESQVDSTLYCIYNPRIYTVRLNASNNLYLSHDLQAITVMLRFPVKTTEL